jgi:hypothetical protein
MKQDYLKKYSRVGRFQEGGAMPVEGQQAPAEQAAPAPAEGQDLQAMLMQAYESQDPQMALQVVNAIVEQMQAAQGGGAQGGMPMAKNGMRMPQPIFRKGGKLRA